MAASIVEAVDWILSHPPRDTPGIAAPPSSDRSGIRAVCGAPATSPDLIRSLVDSGMKLRPITSLAYVLLVVAAIASCVLVYLLKPTSAEATAALGIWLLLPYLILAVMVGLSTRAADDVANLAVTLFVVAGGLLFLVVVIFVRSDPQGGIAVFFTPVYQGVAMVVLIPLSRWIFGKGSA